MDSDLTRKYMRLLDEYKMVVAEYVAVAPRERRGDILTRYTEILHSVETAPQSPPTPAREGRYRYFTAESETPVRAFWRECGGVVVFITDDEPPQASHYEPHRSKTVRLVEPNEAVRLIRSWNNPANAPVLAECEADLTPPGEASVPAEAMDLLREVAGCVYCPDCAAKASALVRRHHHSPPVSRTPGEATDQPAKARGEEQHRCDFCGEPSCYHCPECGWLVHLGHAGHCKSDPDPGKAPPPAPADEVRRAARGWAAAQKQPLYAIQFLIEGYLAGHAAALASAPGRGEPYKSPELLVTAGPERQYVRAGWHAALGEGNLAELCLDAARKEPHPTPAAGVPEAIRSIPTVLKHLRQELAGNAEHDAAEAVHKVEEQVKAILALAPSPSTEPVGGVALPADLLDKARLNGRCYVGIYSRFREDPGRYEGWSVRVGDTNAAVDTAAEIPGALMLALAKEEAAALARPADAQAKETTTNG